MDFPKNLKSIGEMAQAYKNMSAGAIEASNAIKKLSSNQKAEYLINNQSADNAKRLSQAELEKVLAKHGVTNATRQSVAETINEIAKQNTARKNFFVRIQSFALNVMKNW